MIYSSYERLVGLFRGMRLEELEDLRDRNNEVANEYRRNADSMDEIVKLMDEEIESRR